MLLRDALPRFHAEATAAIAAKPDDEMPQGVSRSALLAQVDTLVLTAPVGSPGRPGSFQVNTPGRPAGQDYAFSFDFCIPSGSVIADLDENLRIAAFEPISMSAMQDLERQLAAISSLARE